MFECASANYLTGTTLGDLPLLSPSMPLTPKTPITMKKQLN